MNTLFKRPKKLILTNDEDKPVAIISCKAGAEIITQIVEQAIREDVDAESCNISGMYEITDEDYDGVTFSVHIFVSDLNEENEDYYSDFKLCGVTEYGEPDLTELKDKELKSELKRRGYYTEKMFNVTDVYAEVLKHVTTSFQIPKDEAMNLMISCFDDRFYDEDRLKNDVIDYLGDHYRPKRSENTPHWIYKINALMSDHKDLPTFTNQSWGNDETDKCITNHKHYEITFWLPNPQDPQYKGFAIQIVNTQNEEQDYLEFEGSPEFLSLDDAIRSLSEWLKNN